MHPPPKGEGRLAVVAAFSSGLGLGLRFGLRGCLGRSLSSLSFAQPYGGFLLCWPGSCACLSSGPSGLGAATSMALASRFALRDITSSNVALDFTSCRANCPNIVFFDMADWVKKPTDGPALLAASFWSFWGGGLRFGASRKRAARSISKLLAQNRASRILLLLLV